MNTDLHERLLAATAAGPEVNGCGECGQHLKAEAALRAVVELHAPAPCPPQCCVRHDHVTCAAGCRAADPYGPHYPCSDIQAIARELGVDHE